MGRRCDRLTFVPSYSSIRQVWGNAHVLVVASRFEGLPLALAEAMTLGRPAVVTDVADCAILLRDGIDGFVAASPTVSAYAKSMELLWERRSELPQMGANAAQRARDFHLTIPFGLLQQPSLLRYPAVEHPPRQRI